jgi:hypothetical protein
MFGTNASKPVYEAVIMRYKRELKRLDSSPITESVELFCESFQPVGRTDRKFHSFDRAQEVTAMSEKWIPGLSGSVYTEMCSFLRQFHVRMLVSWLRVYICHSSVGLNHVCNLFAYHIARVTDARI